MIAWRYLDKKAAAADALRDYASMEYIIANHEDMGATLRGHMEAVPSAAPTGQPRANNPHANEERLVSRIDEIDVLKERYRQAREYIAWFKPAWDELSADDRFILREFFTTEGSKLEAVGRINQRLYLEKSQIYYRKDKALNQLALLLYGK